MRDGMAFHWTTAAALFVLYAVISFAGAGWWYAIVFGHLDGAAPGLDDAVLAAVSASLAASGIFYARKLYKDLFAADPALVKSQHALLATTAYFVFRPLFAIAIAGMSVLGAFAFVHAVTEHDSKIGFGFLIFASIAGAFLSSVTGEGVSRFEQLGKAALESLRPSI